MDWHITVGIETHVQLATASKMFSSASTSFGANPNSQASLIDFALPGVLPTVNMKAIEYAIRFGLAVEGKINDRSVFDRKNYFYPDLPKGYQISQFEKPIVEGGDIKINTDGNEKKVRLTRAHLEEDAGKSLHETHLTETGIDLNRAGTPLLEIVTEPDIKSATEAVTYAKTLYKLVTWIGICEGNMQEGNFRCDANVSVSKNRSQLGIRREIKNLNSFKFLFSAIEYEASWQIEQLKNGKEIQQGTVLYDDLKNETRLMRSKEDANDYRYFPDPDLLPILINSEVIDRVKQEMPESPQKTHDRFRKDFGLSESETNQICSDRSTAGYYEQAVAATESKIKSKDANKLVLHWILGDLFAHLKRDEKDIKNAPISPTKLAQLVDRISDGTLSSKLAKKVFEEIWHTNKEVGEVISEQGFVQITDQEQIGKIIDDVIESNPNLVNDYQNGKSKAFNAMIGQVMKATQGKANPKQVSSILKGKLS